jgi:hypothetical protein
MRTVRRLYFYAVAFVSLEIVLWGMIGLARSIGVSSHEAGSGAGRLAQALALILVGVPVFGFHWWWSQRNARQDMEEHASGVRAVFLYAVLLGTLIPILQNFLALLNRLLLQALGLSASQAMFGPYQTWSDNLIAMLMNAVVAAYFITVLRADWGTVIPRETLAAVRRIYRYIWVLYALVFVVAGIQQLLTFIFSLPSTDTGTYYPAPLADGLALAVIGAPVWFFAWKTIQDSLSDPAERDSQLRLGLLYFLALAGVVTVLSSAGTAVDVVLRAIFGEHMTFADFLQRVSGPLSIGVPLAGVWAYYGGWLGRAMAASADAPRRAGMRRLYHYILSAIGLGATFVGLSLLLSFVVDAALGNLFWGDVLRLRLAAALATLAAGLPLWWLSWRPMQAEALSPGDPGDHARRSVVRKVYLYIALFASVVGGMVTAAGLLTILLRAAFGQPEEDLVRSVLNLFGTLFLFSGLGLYHGLILRLDGRRSASALAERQAAFPVLVFDPGDGLFAETLLGALRKQAPGLPVAVQPAGKAVGKGAVPKAVLLPSSLALDPPEPLRRWIGGYKGSRLVVPYPAPGWTWAGGMPSLPAAATHAALAVRQLAEGQEIRVQTGTSGWLVLVYILAGLFGLELVLALIGLTASLFAR